MNRNAMIAMALLCGWIAMVALGSPLEATQGWSQKIFYLHVPPAMMMYVCFIIAALSSLMYLKSRTNRWDDVSVAFLELGLVCCTIVLVTGPIWARPIWGTYWTWEPRLTTTLLLWLIFLAARSSRFAFSSIDHARKAYAVILCVGCLNIPLVHLSVRLFRGIHPSVLQNDEGLTSQMKIYFLGSVIFQVLFLGCAARARLERGSKWKP